MVAGHGSPEKPTRVAGLIVAALAAVAIALATLRNGDPTVLQPTPLTCLVCGDAGLVDVWRNVALFLPLGAGLGLIGRRARTALLVGFCLSLVIETTQHAVLVGRDASLSDLLTNSLGAALGAALVRTRSSWLRPRPRVARRLALGAAALWATVLTLAGVGLRWDVPGPPYHLNELPPRAGALRAFEGRVLETRIDGRAVGAGVATDLALLTREEGTLRLDAIVEPSYPPGKLRPIIWAFDDAWREVFVFGQRGQGLVVRLRTRSAAARLLSPTFVLDGAFGGPGERVAVQAVVQRASVTLRASDGRAVREARIRRSIALGWTLFQPWSWGIERLASLLGALWLAMPGLALAYWAALGTRHGASRAAGAATALGVATAMMLMPVAVSAALDLAPLHPGHLAAVAAGAAVGWGAGRHVRSSAITRAEHITTRPS